MATATSAVWQPIGETVAEFRSECGEFEHGIESLFDQLDHLRSELDRKMREVERERHRLAERERQLSDQRKETSRIAHQFEHQEAKLSETLAELDELKNLVRRAVEDSSERESQAGSQLEKQFESLQRERQALQRQLAEAQSEITKQSALARDLAAARQEINDLRSSISSSEGGAVRLPEDQERVSELEQERAALEAELELVRGRAAELHEAVAQERRALAEHRAETNNELKQLRRLVEKQAELLNERVVVPAAPSSREVSVADVAEEPPQPASDPVINSVMAQFAKLQKEVAERRKHRK